MRRCQTFAAANSRQTTLLAQDRRAAFHYDVSNDFYRCGSVVMVYSCAYFHSLDDDLGTAQERKLDYLCRKLRLRTTAPTRHWLRLGALVIHATKHFGACGGITLRTASGMARGRWGADWQAKRRSRAGVYREIAINGCGLTMRLCVGWPNTSDASGRPTRRRPPCLPSGAFLNQAITRTLWRGAG